jgi:hypothetical protein
MGAPVESSSPFSAIILNNEIAEGMSRKTRQSHGIFALT